MRRLLFVLLGLVLLGGAIGTFSYRWFVEPSRTTQVIRPGAAPSTRGATEAQRRDPRGQQVSAYNTFEIALNVANLVVGVVGIWLAVSGVRARRS